MTEEIATTNGTAATGSATTSGSPAAPTGAPASQAVVTQQLTQARVPLDETADALATPDASGRLPIVVLPLHALRIRNDAIAGAVIAFAIALVLDLDVVVRGALLAAAAILVVLGVFRSFLVPVPEGAQAILLQRGRFHRRLGPGNHVVPPWIIVSHFVTTREIPFDAPSIEIPTKDDVRTDVDILLTFKIAAPESFVFTISAPDFDQICQATCQETVRLLIRAKDADQVLDLSERDADALRAAIGDALERYGVEIVRVVVTHVMPPMEFVASREARRLAIVHRAEEEEQHALALLRQSDREALDRQRIAARRQAIELEAANEVARLGRLEDRIRDFPNAMHWDVESLRLEVARALASNTRAMVQVGSGGDVAASLLMHTLPEDGAKAVEPAARTQGTSERRGRQPRPRA